MKKYLVVLEACGNIDHNENPFLNVVNGCIVGVGFEMSDSIEGCQKIVEMYINRYNLGAGNWSGGEVFEDGEFVGKISYNRRFWSKDSEDAKEFGHDKCDRDLSIKVKEFFETLKPKGDCNMKVENGFYVRELKNIPFDKAFTLEDGNECLCHSTGVEVCRVENNPSDNNNWWNEYEGADGNLYYGR